jgi:hypothetical protein
MSRWQPRKPGSLKTLWPPEIGHFLSAIGAALWHEVGECQLLLVGSLSDGSGAIDARWCKLVIKSDIDLLIVLPEHSPLSLNHVLQQRERHSEVVRKCMPQLHRALGSPRVSIRYRLTTEMSAFARKCKSLGYDLHSAISLGGRQWVEDGDQLPGFHIGHVAENLCSKFWAIIRYLEWSCRASNSDGIRRMLDRAEASMASSLGYGCSDVLSVMPKEISCRREVTTKTVQEKLAYIVARYGPIVCELTSKYRVACSRLNEPEFDAFYMTSGSPSQLAAGLTLVVEALSLSHEDIVQQTRLLRNASEWLSYPEQVPIPPAQQYSRIRYLLGKRRFATSELFRRDRGPSFLPELRRALSES